MASSGSGGETLSTDALLLHPVFWPRKRTKEFLCNLSDVIQSDVNIKSAFNKLFKNVVSQDSWIDQLDDDPRTYFDKKTLENGGDKKLYHGSSLSSLLRAIRNLAHHIDEEYAADAKKYFDVSANMDQGKSRNHYSGSKGKKTIKVRTKLTPYFGENVDDSVAYWLHKFPKLLPVCYVFSQTNRRMRSKDNYFVEDGPNAKFSMDKHSSVEAIFNELYVCTTRAVNQEKLLRQYAVPCTTLGATRDFKFLKMHPWVLGENSLVVIKYLRGRVVLRKVDQLGKLVGRSQNANDKVDIGGLKCFVRGCLCTDLWKSKTQEFHHTSFIHDNLVLLLCGKTEVGLKHAYWTNRYTFKYTVIFTQDSHREVARSVKAFQNHEGLTNRRNQEQPKFHEVHLKWIEVKKNIQRLLLKTKVYLQNNVEILQNVIDYWEESDSQNNILADMDNNFILHLIHAREVGCPQIIKDFGSPDYTVEMTRKLMSSSFDLDQLDERGMFHREALRENANCTKVLQNTPLKEGEYVTEDHLLPPAKTPSKHCIISGASGMGKSTLLNRLANKLANEAHPTQKAIVMFLRFPEIVKALGQATLTISKKVLSTVISSAITSSQFCSMLLIPVISGKGDYIIYLLLDAFDEVGDEDREKCVQVLQLICTEFSHIKMYVTARTENTQRVETSLQAASTYRLQPLDHMEKGNFLTNYWLKRVCVNASEEELLRQKSILQELASGSKYITVGTRDLYGSPFCLMLMAEVCLEFIRQGELGIQSLEETEFEDLKALFNKFVASKMSTIYAKKYQPGIQGEALRESMSFWYTPEKGELLAVCEHDDENVMPVVFQAKLE